MSEFRQELPNELKQYHQFNDDLYTVDGVVHYKGMVDVPHNLRRGVLETFHAA